MVDIDTFDYNDIEIVNYNDKIDFDGDLEELDKMTKSIKVDWKIRESAMKKIAGICLGNYKHNDSFLKYFNNKFYKNLNIQFKEKRSIIIRETCRIISFCIKVQGTYIEKAITYIISHQNIFSIIEKNENKVSMEYVSLCIFNILRYLKIEKMIDIIFEKKNSNIDPIRILCAKCFFLFLKEYPSFMINEKLNLFYEIFNQFLIDSNEEVKSIIRQAFFEFKKIMPSEAGIYFNSLNKKLQQQIKDEDKFNKNLLFYKNKLNNKSYSAKKKILSTNKKNKNENELNKSNILPEIGSSYPINNYNNDNNNLMYSISYNKKNYNNNERIGSRSVIGRNKKNLDNNKDEDKNETSKKIQLERLNKKLMQLNIVTGNNDDFKSNPDNISDEKLKELKKLNIVKDEILNRRERNIDKSVLYNRYMLIEEKLLMYIYKLENCTTSGNKLAIFEYIYNEFEIILHGIDKISKLTDIDHKLVEQIIKNLIRMIYYMEKIFENYNIESIIKILITHMSSGNEKIILLSKELLNIIRHKFDNEEIFKALYDLLNEGDNDLSDICYQYLYVIIPNCESILNIEANFKKLYKLICLSDVQIYHSLGNIIKFLYKNYKDYFNASFDEEDKENKNNIIKIMEKSKCSFCKIFKEKYKEFCLNEKEEEEKKEEEKRTLEMLQRYKSEEDEFEKIPFEIGTAIKTGDIKLFINYINNNISYIPEYLLLLSNPKFNGSIYSINLINFTYYLLSNKKYINKLNSCVELITNQTIHLFLTNTSNKNAINSIKDILNIIPFKLDSKKFLKSISNYLNNNTDIILLQSLIICIKNFIQNNKSENLEELLPLFIDNLFSLFNHSLEEIRKHAVVCCSKIYSILGRKFDTYLLKLPKNHQNWIHIFVNKKNI